MQEEEKKYEEPIKPVTTPPTPQSSGQVTSGLKALFIILAVLFPIVGIILGIIWLSRNTKEEKALGKLTLTIGIAMFAVSCICWFISFAIGVFRGVSEQYGLLFYHFIFS